MPMFKFLAAFQSALLAVALAFSIAATPVSASDMAPVAIAFERASQPQMSTHPHLQRVQTCLGKNAQCGSAAACTARCCSKAWYATSGGCHIDKNRKSVCDNTLYRKCE